MTEPSRRESESAGSATEVLDPGQRSLGELAETVRIEHAAVIASGTAMIQHAIRAGEALLEAKAKVPRGQWQRWLVDNFAGDEAAWVSESIYVYMRVARHQELVLESGVQTLTQARQMLSRTVYGSTGCGGFGVPLIDLDHEVIDMVRRKEITQAEAAKRLGVSIKTVRNRLDGGRSNRAAQERMRARRREARQRERDQLARAAGGSVSEAYSLVRRALQQLDREHAKASGDAKAAMSVAISRLHAAEDQIVKALRHA